MNNQTKRGTTPRGAKPRPGYGKDPFEAVHKVNVKKISKQNTARGGAALEGKYWGKVLQKGVGEAYLASLKAGVVKLQTPKELPGGPYRKPQGRRHPYKNPKWVPGPGVYPKKSASNTIPAYQGGPGH